MQRTAVIAFTKKGQCLAHRLQELFDSPADAWTVCVCQRLQKDVLKDSREEILLPDAHTWMKSNWNIYKRFVFVSAMGIAVRLTAPCLKDKLTDPAVIVLDERASFVIPVLSGHVGGANEAARQIAKKTGAVPVITTATDVEGCFAVDVFARANGLAITDRVAARMVSAVLLEGKRVGCYMEYPYAGKLPEQVAAVEKEEELSGYPAAFAIRRVDRPGSAEHRGFVLELIPKDVVIGIGCKKGMAGERIREAVEMVCERLGISDRRIAAFASIDLKRQEQGICETARDFGVPFLTYPAEALETIGQVSRESEFVRQVAGTGNVSERAALYGAGAKTAQLLLPKLCCGGITVAAARKEWRMHFE